MSHLKRGLPQQDRARFVAFSLWLLLVGTFWGYSQTLDLSPLELLWRVIDRLATSGYGPLLFVGIFLVRPLLFFSVALLIAAGGYLYGPAWGTVYTIIGGNLSALVAYLLGYHFKWAPVEKASTDGLLQRSVERMRHNSFETVLALRFLLLPHDVVSYLAGILRINWKSYLLATVIGTLPSTLGFTLFGASIEGDFRGDLPAVDPAMVALSITFFFPCVLFSHYLRRRDRLRDAGS